MWPRWLFNLSNSHWVWEIRTQISIKCNINSKIKEIAISNNHNINNSTNKTRDFKTIKLRIKRKIKPIARLKPREIPITTDNRISRINRIFKQTIKGYKVNSSLKQINKDIINNKICNLTLKVNPHNRIYKMELPSTSNRISTRRPLLKVYSKDKYQFKTYSSNYLIKIIKTIKLNLLVATISQHTNPREITIFTNSHHISIINSSNQYINHLLYTNNKLLILPIILSSTFQNLTQIERNQFVEIAQSHNNMDQQNRKICQKKYRIENYFAIISWELLKNKSTSISMSSVK